MTIVLSVVFKNAFNMAPEQYVTPERYTPFLFLGITLWQFLVESMSQGCNSFKSSATFIRQQPVPLGIFPLRMALGSAIHTGIALLVGVLLTWYYVGLPPPLVALSLLPGLIILFLVGVALATLMGIVHTHFPD